MSDVQFEDDPQIAVRKAKTKRTGSLTAWIIRSKLAKDEKQASVVLLVILALCILAIGALYFISEPKTSHVIVPLTQTGSL